MWKPLKYDQKMELVSCDYKWNEGEHIKLNSQYFWTMFYKLHFDSERLIHYKKLMSYNVYVKCARIFPEKNELRNCCDWNFNLLRSKITHLNQRSCNCHCSLNGCQNSYFELWISFLKKVRSQKNNFYEIVNLIDKQKYRPSMRQGIIKQQNIETIS